MPDPTSSPQAWQENILRSYEGRLYMHHMVLIHEWNEETSFLPLSTTIIQNDVATHVIQDIRVRYAHFSDEGKFIGLSTGGEIDHFHAIYGDGDELRKFVVLNNRNDNRGVSVLVNDVIRS